MLSRRICRRRAPKRKRTAVRAMNRRIFRVHGRCYSCALKGTESPYQCTIAKETNNPHLCSRTARGETGGSRCRIHAAVPQTEGKLTSGGSCKGLSDIASRNISH